MQYDEQLGENQNCSESVGKHTYGTNWDCFLSTTHVKGHVHSRLKLHIFIYSTWNCRHEVCSHAPQVSHHVTWFKSNKPEATLPCYLALRLGFKSSLPLQLQHVRVQSDRKYNLKSSLPNIVPHTERWSNSSYSALTCCS